MELLVHVEALEDRQVLDHGVVVLDAVDELGVHLPDVVAHLRVETLVVDDHVPVLAVEFLAHDPHSQVGLAIEQSRCIGPVGLGFDGLPQRHQSLDVVAQLVLARPLRCGADDQAVTGGAHLIDDPAQPLALVVVEPLGDTEGAGVGDHDHEPTRERDLLGEPRPFGADRVLRDLAQDDLAGAQHLLDTRRGALCRFDVLDVVADVTAVEHGVLGGADVDEGGLHAGEDVLDPAPIDVAVDLGGIV